MKNKHCSFLVLSLFLLPLIGFAQTPTKWNVNGNVVANGDFLGTTNNQPLIFYSNNTEGMRLKTNGELRINNLGSTGNSFVTANSNGELRKILYSNDSNQVLTGAGTFRAGSSFGPWQKSGNSVFLSSGNVGIGTNAPQHRLDVNGDAHFNGTVFANGITLLNRMEADTIKGADMVEVNNNLELSGGVLNEVYTKTGDLRLQSHFGMNGNLLLSTGTTGKVGIGIFTPQYKFDVNGDARVSGKLYAYRILGTLGDSVVRFGDSTVVINYVTGRIFNNDNTRGMGYGQSAWGVGARSTAIGYMVVADATAPHAIAMGCGVLQGNVFHNTIPNSLAITFNSDRATLFVSPGAGANTIGRVGVGTTNPRAMLQVGNGLEKITMGSSYGVIGTNGNTYSLSYIGFNVARTAPNQWETENDGGGNGGVVLLGDAAGGIRFIGVPSTGSTNQVLNDQFIADHTKFYLRNDGRVVIGSETMVGGPRDVPSTMLTVDGSIVCRELFVTKNNWADSIFSPDYNLMSLDSLQRYLNANGHLPGVPSEESVKANGIELGQTDVILLAKIEELTLYMLNLEKQNAIIRKEIEELKNK